MGIGFEGNEAGHGSNEGAQSAHIHTQEKGRPVFRIGRKHDRGRHIADKLGEEKGYPEGGIAPGTKWEDIPEDFECPLCFVGKDQFSEA